VAVASSVSASNAPHDSYDESGVRNATMREAYLLEVIAEENSILEDIECNNDGTVVADKNNDDDYYDDEEEEDKQSHTSFELCSDYWSDSGVDDDGNERGGCGDLKLQESIDAIREEAARVSSVMAMDRLDTLRQEIDAIRRALSGKDAELTEQRALCKLKDDRLATLELERDLYRADATKFKNDLMEVVQGAADAVTTMAANATAGCVGSSHFNLPDRSPPMAGRSTSSSPAPDAGQRPGEETSGISMFNNEETKVEQREEVFLTPQWMVQKHRSLPEGPAIRQANRPESSCEDGIFGTGFAKHRSIESLSRKYLRSGSTSHAHFHRDRSSRDFHGPNKELASFIVSGKVKDTNEELEKTISRLSLRRFVSPKHQRNDSNKKHRSLQQPLNSTSGPENVDPMSEIELTRICLEAQVEDLYQRLRASRETVEKLQCRLAAVDSYYESLVHKLQSRLSSAEFEKAHMEADLVNQVTSIDMAKQRAISALEARLREKEDDIERLKRIRSCRH